MLPQTFVDDHKRERCALAVAEIVHESGVRGLTVTLVTKRARVARNTFYHLFKNQEEALRHAYDLGNHRLREAVEGNDSGGRTIDEALRALLAAAEDEPYLIELCLAHGRGILRETGPDEETVVEALAAALGRARASARNERGNSTVCELLALGILALISSCLRRGKTHSLTTLHGPLAELVRVQLGLPQPIGNSQRRALGDG